MATVSLIKGSANTGPSFYLSSSDINSSCQSMQDKVNTECGKNADLSNKSALDSTLENKKIKENTDAIKAKLPDLETTLKKKYGYIPQNDANSWIEKHCYGLWLKPMGGPTFAPFKDIITKMKAGLEKSVRSGTKTPAEANPKIRELTRMLIDDRKHPDNITSSTVLAEMMSAAAEANPCIKARRCILVPYKNTEKQSIDGKSHSAGAAQAKKGNGCCPGQTGHHILPGAMFEKDEEPKKCKKDYNHSEAPVICVEGTGNQVGTHGDAHLALQKLMAAYKKNGAATISYPEARELGIEAVREVNSDCTEECLRAQLDAHYESKLECQDAKLTPHSGMADAAKTKDEKKAEKAIKNKQKAQQKTPTKTKNPQKAKPNTKTPM